MPDTIIEKKEPPQHVVDRITRAGGLNQYGKPNFRVVWGGSRTYVVGGLFKKVVMVKRDEMIIGGAMVPIVTDVAEFHTLLKYHPHRWHMERYRDASFYGTREEWYQSSWSEEAQLHTMGDYPNEGDYEHVFYLGICSHMKIGDTDWCYPCQVSMGEYIPLEENVHILEMQIKALYMTQDVSRDEERRALFMREGDKRQARRKIVEDRVREAMRPKLVVENPSTLMDDLGHCKIPDANISKTVDRDDVHLGFNQV